MEPQYTPILKDKLVYRLKDIEISAFARFKNYVSAIHGRKKLFLQFCSKNGISLPVHEDHSYRMPKEYLIQHSRIEHFGVLRDRIVVELYRDYKIRMANLDEQIALMEEKIRLQKEYLAAEKRRLENEKKQFSSSKDPLRKIYLESNIDMQSTKIDNQTTVLNNLESEKLTLLEIKSTNKKTWKRQLEDTEKAMRALTQKFVDRISRKIAVKFHFTDFSYVLPDYDKRVKELLGEE